MRFKRLNRTVTLFFIVVHRAILVPSPFIGPAPLPEAPVSPAAPSITLPPVNVVVNFPTPKEPEAQEILSQSLPSTGKFSSLAFRWNRGRATAIKVVNAHDVTVRVRLYPSFDSNTSNTKVTPVLEFDVGPGGSKIWPVNPESGDIWTPYLFAEVEALSDPSGGGSILVNMVRQGD